MYQERTRRDAFLAVALYIVWMLALWVMGILLSKGITAYSLLYWALFAVSVIIVWVRDKSFVCVGFTGEKWKMNTAIAAGIVLITAVTGFVFSDLDSWTLWKNVFKYLFYIGLIEEVMFRGIIQSHLFGFKCSRKLIYVIGGVFFALMHLPFQMYRHDMVSLQYVVEAWPQLNSTFWIHLLLCWITRKRGDILIPVAIHFAMNYLGTVL